MYLRAVDPKWMFNAEFGALGNITGVKKVFAQSFAPILLKRRINQRLQMHGYGRNSQDEIEEILRKDLKALSTLLGDKPFFFGPTPSSVCYTSKFLKQNADFCSLIQRHLPISLNSLPVPSRMMSF